MPDLGQDGRVKGFCLLQSSRDPGCHGVAILTVAISIPKPKTELWTVFHWLLDVVAQLFPHPIPWSELDTGPPPTTMGKNYNLTMFLEKK